MNWIQLTNETQLSELKENSIAKPQVIFKHSTTCSISSMVMNRLEKTDLPQADVYYLDLLQHRDISNKIAEDFRVEHESPQILVIKDGLLTYDADHMAIRVDDLEEAI